MDLGVIFSQADSGTDPDAIRDWARTADEAGFTHLMAYDHILGATPERLGPGPFGSFPGPPYTTAHTFHEILVLFGHLAAVTTATRVRHERARAAATTRGAGREADRDRSTS